ncbi:MAG: hypothetical protein KBT34_13655 [Prevotella sp.]|nr:hypothetical protein [Candidatus Prevotella equi]
MKKFLLFLMLLVTSIASWAADPYFEVISGSFESGNVTLKITFPDATTVAISSGDWDGLSLYHLDNPQSYYSIATSYNYYHTHTVEGNTITATFSNFTPFGNDLRYYITSYDLTVDEVSFNSNIYSKDAMPYAEVLSGSLTSGNLSVKVVLPSVSSINPDLGPSYTVSLWNNGEKLEAKTKDSDVTVDGNTISMAYNFTAQASDDLSSCAVKIDRSTFQFDGAWNAAMEISFKTTTPAPSGCAHENLTRHEEVESTDQIHGHSAYDECDDCGACFAITDTEHETPLTAADFLLPLDTDPINYFYIQNLDDENTWIAWGEGNRYNYGLEYSYDKEEWNVFGNERYNLPAYGRIYLRASITGNESLYYSNILVGGYQMPYDEIYPIEYYPYYGHTRYEVGGDITTLLRSNGKVMTLPEAKPHYEEGSDDPDGVEGVFEELFGNTHYLMNASNLVLPSTTLSANCYKGLFEWAVYFNGAPSLPATNLDANCYYSMFGECWNLETAPALPAMNIAPGCYQMMFNNCHNLQNAPASLPATKLAVDCYKQMFSYCQMLQTAPELPAPSLVDGCYVQMFYNCSNLNYIKVGLMTDWPVHITPSDGYGSSTYDYYCTRDWVAGVAYDGTFNGASCLYKEYIPYGGLYSVVPRNWNSENPLTVPVTISSAGYSTFCYDRNWIIPQGTVGYIGYVDESGSFHFEKAYNPGDIVNSYRTSYETYEDGNRIQQWVCKAVVLKGASGTYTVTLTDEFGDDSETLRENNQLYGSMHDFDLNLYRNWNDDYYGYISSDYYYYTLSLDKTGKNVGFYWMNSTGAPFITKPYKAFLRVKKDMLSNVKKSFVFDSDETITGVYTVPTKEKKHTDNNIYDLSGRRVMNANAKGLYIINGKKVVK